MKNKIKTKGFTLIETTIYIALFSLLIGTAFITAYQLLDGSLQLNEKNTTESEGNFFARKISWAFSGVKTIDSPSKEFPVSDILILTKYDGNEISVQKNGTKIEIKGNANGNNFEPITTDNIKVSDLTFSYIELSSSSPPGVIATAIINGETFTVTKFIRK